jgi:hypothetical protein
MQEYVSALSAKIDPSDLASRRMKCVIIGCGHHSLIQDYTDMTGAKYPIYADPDQNLYKTFSLVRSLQWGGKPEYMSFGMLAGIKKGIMNSFKVGIGKSLKSGDMKQDGGEYVLFEYTNIDSFLDRGINVLGDIG